MNSINYEPHIYKDPSFPIIFHYDFRTLNDSFLTHWHENIEILYIINGSISILSDANRFNAKKGDFVIINSNNIHHIKALEKNSQYYCLIIGKKLCQEFGISIEQIEFQRLIKDNKLYNIFNKIKNEMETKDDLFKSAVKSAVIDFIIYMYRNYKIFETTYSQNIDNTKIGIVKQTIKFIQLNYANNISTANIAKELGISTSYLCRIFKDVTGYTIIYYLNLLRCSNAKILLQTGNYKIFEVAYLCGYDNLSYFTKTYKKYIGYVPSLNKS